MDLAGVILDIYDDPKGLVLRNKLAGKQLSQKLAASRLLEHGELEQLPDHLFALVATNHGDTLRKYAMHDEGHLTTSIIYFAECGHLLPDHVRQKVAANLVEGCGWYDQTPPEFLTKLAFLETAMNALTVGQGLGDMANTSRSESARGRERMDVFRANQMAGAKVGSVADNPVLNPIGSQIRRARRLSGEKVASGREVQLTMDQDAAMQRAEGPESGYIFGPLDQFSQHGPTHKKLERQVSQGEMIEISKKSDLTNTEAMTHQRRPSDDSRPTPVRSADVTSKTSSLGVSVDLTNESAPVRTKKASSQRFALPHLNLYPIDSAAQLKQASEYLDEHLYAFLPVDRRAFAQSLLDRAEELGVKVSGSALAYGGREYGPFVEPELHARVESFRGTGHESVYEVLLEKFSSVSPAVLAEMLREADHDSGAKLAYGRPGVGFRDPYEAVYGRPKLAEEMPPEEDTYSWRSGGDYVNGQMLKALASRKADLDVSFGSGFSHSFARDPVGIFKSMPDPQKVVLSRLASDNSSQTFRI